MATATKKTSARKTSKAKTTQAKPKSAAQKHGFDEKLSDALKMGKKGFEAGKQQTMEQAEILLAKLEKEVKDKPRHSMFIAFLVGIIIGRFLLK